MTNITQIIWPATEKRLKAHPGWDEISAKYDEALLSEKPWTFLDWLSHDGRTIGGKAVKDDNTWELLHLQPYMLGALLQEGTDLPLIAHHYEKRGRLISVRRSPASVVPGYEAGDDGRLDLAAMIKEHTSQTVLWEIRDQSALAEYLAWHHLASQ